MMPNDLRWMTPEEAEKELSFCEPCFVVGEGFGYGPGGAVPQIAEWAKDQEVFLPERPSCEALYPWCRVCRAMVPEAPTNLDEEK